jgi:hypothetical protein
VEFNIGRALWKALRSALLAVVVVIISSGSVDVFFDTLSSGINPIVPVYLVPVIAAVITLLRNFTKQWLKEKCL